MPVLEQATKLRVGPAAAHAAYAGSALKWFDPRALGNLEVWLDAEFTAGFAGGVPADGTLLESWQNLKDGGALFNKVGSSTRALVRTENRNLLTFQQAGIEFDATGFQVQTANATLARVTTPVKSGLGALSITGSGAGGAITFSILAPVYTQRVPVIAGRTYTFAMSSRAATTVRACTLSVYWYNAAGGSLGPTSGGTATNSNAAWTDHRYSVVAPANAAYAYPHFSVSGAVAVGEIHYMDELGAWEGSSAVWVPPVTLPGGKPTIQGDGIDDAYAGAVNAMDTTGVSSYLVVSRDRNTAVIQRLYRVTNVATLQHTFGNTTGISGFFAGGSNASAPALANGVPAVLSGISTPADTQAFLNGVGGALGVIAPTGMTGTTFTFLTQGGGPFAGSISALLIFSESHTPAKRQAVERWLGSKYGIAVA